MESWKLKKCGYMPSMHVLNIIQVDSSYTSTYETIVHNQSCVTNIRWCNWTKVKNIQLLYLAYPNFSIVQEF